MHRKQKTVQISKQCSVSNHRNLTNPPSAFNTHNGHVLLFEVNKYELILLITLKGHTCRLWLHTAAQDLANYLIRASKGH